MTMDVTKGTIKWNLSVTTTYARKTMALTFLMLASNVLWAYGLVNVIGA